MSRISATKAAGTGLLDRRSEIHGETAALLVQHSEPVVGSVSGSGIFITPDGAWLREGSAEFFVALGDPDPDYDAPLFAIKNLGFIFVQVTTAARVDITLQPRNVAPAALRALQRWLQSFQISCFKFNYVRDQWISEILTTSAQVLCRLFEISSLEMNEDANYVESAVAGNMAPRQAGSSAIAH